MNELTTTFLVGIFWVHFLLAVAILPMTKKNNKQLVFIG